MHLGHFLLTARRSALPCVMTKSLAASWVVSETSGSSEAGRTMPQLVNRQNFLLGTVQDT